MIQRVSVYLKNIEVESGSVLFTRGTDSFYMEPNSKKSKWLYKINANYLQPKDCINLMGSGMVRIRTYTKDIETENFHNLGSFLITDRISKLRIRQFLVVNVLNINKTISREGVVLADIEY
jgi:hypothetical protein